MSSTGRAPQPPDAPADSHDSTVVLVTGARLPSRVTGSVARKYPSAQVMPISEFTGLQPDAGNTVIFIGEDLRDAWEVATASDASEPDAPGPEQVRLAFLTASAAGLDALTGYRLDSAQPSADCLIIDLRRTETSGDAAGWLAKLVGVAAPSVAAKPASVTPKGSRTPAGRTGALGGLLRRYWVGVLLLAAVAILCGIVASLAFASAWVGLFLAGFAVIALAQVGLAVLTYRTSSAARKTAQAVAKAQQEVADQVRLITASSAETALVLREQARGQAPSV
ncbi:MAG: hypothetical protein K4304_07795 [Propionicimonas sp.]